MVFSIIPSWQIVLHKKTFKRRLRSYATEEEYCEAAGAGGEAGGRGGGLGQRKALQGSGIQGAERRRAKLSSRRLSSPCCCRQSW